MTRLVWQHCIWSTPCTSLYYSWKGAHSFQCISFQNCSREHTVRCLKTTNKIWNAHGQGIHCWDCVHMIECLCLLSLPLGWDWRLWQVSRHSAGQIWSPSWRNPVFPEQRTNILVLQDFRVNVVWGRSYITCMSPTVHRWDIFII